MTPALHVVLVEPEIHWNTGNAGRTCLAVGAQLHLVRPLGFSLADKHVRRAGLDYWPRVKPVVWDDWAAFAAALPGLGAPFLFAPRWPSTSGASPAPAETPPDYTTVDYPERAVLIFGRESVGLPAQVLVTHADRVVAIPMLDPELRSLNLSTTVAVAAFEVRRQWLARGYSPSSTVPGTARNPASRSSA